LSKQINKLESGKEYLFRIDISHCKHYGDYIDNFIYEFLGKSIGNPLSYKFINHNDNRSTKKGFILDATRDQIIDYGIMEVVRI